MSLRSHAICLSMAAAMVFAPAPAHAVPECLSGPRPDAEWPAAPPAEAGLDAELLCGAGDMLRSRPGADIHSFLVARHGKLVHESYYDGADQIWGRDIGPASHDAATLHDLRSVTKSIVGLLAGIAHDRKLIASLDDPVRGYFPDLAARLPAGAEAITIRHLLTMTSGLRWDESMPYGDPRNGERRMIGAGDPIGFVLGRGMRHPAGAAWNYSGGDTQLLAGVIEKATGQAIEDFAREALFDPIGVHAAEWMRMPGSGEAAAASGLRMRPRDMAKIGQLVLQEGEWQGRQIVSSSWIESMTSAQVTGFDAIASVGYGYQWWTDHEALGGRDVHWTSAQGLGGQRIYVAPALGLVVVITAGHYGDRSFDGLPYSLFSGHVLKAVGK